jgi:hypothetical protein
VTCFSHVELCIGEEFELIRLDLCLGKSWLDDEDRQLWAQEAATAFDINKQLWVAFFEPCDSACADALVVPQQEVLQ